MSIFKKLFGDENESKPTMPIDSPVEQKQTVAVNPLVEPKVEPTKIKRNIFDFFQIDLRTIPDDTFIKGEVTTNIVGTVVEWYRKPLGYKECGIFDVLEVVVIGGKDKNAFLKSFEPLSIKIEELKKLIDELYLIHGNDRDNKAMFNSSDIEDYFSTEFYTCFGRSWTDRDKYQNTIEIGRGENEVSISIWGIDKF